MDVDIRLACAAEAGKGRAEVSPLGKLILRIMRVGAYAAAAFVAFVIGIEFWKASQAAAVMPDYKFLTVLALMLLGSLWLARAISKELRNHS